MYHIKIYKFLGFIAKRKRFDNSVSVFAPPTTPASWGEAGKQPPHLNRASGLQFTPVIPAGLEHHLNALPGLCVRVGETPGTEVPSSEIQWIWVLILSLPCTDLGALSDFLTSLSFSFLILKININLVRTLWIVMRIKGDDALSMYRAQQRLNER